MTTPSPRFYFYPRPPRGGRRRSTPGDEPFQAISIHALREEGDGAFLFLGRQPRNFYPRPPRGGRPKTTTKNAGQDNFYPRPPRGGRLAAAPITNKKNKFLSTPSARRATDRGEVQLCSADISIHALREEGDERFNAQRFGICDFYPRPPRGGRQEACTAALEADDISIHALREEGDKIVYSIRQDVTVFLSTPSARRATVHCRLDSALVIISIHALREEGDGSSRLHR